MTMRISSEMAGAVLTIDLDALAANYRLVAELVRPARTAAVVKADGYGLGARQVANAFAAAGCSDFFVAHLTEAAELAGALPPGTRLFVLNGLQPGAEEACARLGCIPVLNSLDQLRRWRAAAIGTTRLPAAIQIDSGMSRLGLPEEELRALGAAPELLDRLEVVLVMSHLACADDAGDAANERQRQRFDALAGLLPLAPRSLANSGGSFLGGGFLHDLVRPGIALYGGTPQGGMANPMRPVVALHARIIQTRTIEPGTGVGYGLTHHADTRQRIATIALGYADGWPRRLGNRGSAFVDGVRVPIVGRVSMDSIMLDVTHVPEAALAPGRPVELLGPHQSIDQVAADADTIAYEILTRLGSRFARHYIGSGATSGVRSVEA